MPKIDTNIYCFEDYKVEKPAQGSESTLNELLSFLKPALEQAIEKYGQCGNDINGLPPNVTVEWFTALDNVKDLYEFIKINENKSV